jgi:hypothetical protein
VAMVVEDYLNELGYAVVGVAARLESGPFLFATGYALPDAPSSSATFPSSRSPTVSATLPAPCSRSLPRNRHTAGRPPGFSSIETAVALFARIFGLGRKRGVVPHPDCSGDGVLDRKSPTISRYNCRCHLDHTPYQRHVRSG